MSSKPEKREKKDEMMPDTLTTDIDLTPTLESRSSTPDEETYDANIEGEEEGEEPIDPHQNLSRELDRVVPDLAKLAIASEENHPDRLQARGVASVIQSNDDGQSESRSRINNVERGSLSAGPDGHSNDAGSNIAGQVTGAANDEDELEKFRAQWRAEVKSKTGPTTKNGNVSDVGAKGVQVGSVKRQGRDVGAESEVASGPRPEKENGAELGIGKDRGRVIEISGKGKGKSKSKGAEEGTQGPRQQPTLTAPTEGRSPSKSTAKLPSPISPKKNLYTTSRTFQTEDDPDHNTGFGTSASKISSGKPQTLNKPVRYQGSIVPSQSGSSGQASTTQLSDGERAVQMYAKAVESEQSGQLNDALLLYRRAFKLDDDVDRSYARSIAKAQSSSANSNSTDAATRSSGQAAIPPTPTSADIISPTPPSVEPYSFARHIQLDPDYEKSHPSQVGPSSSSSNSHLDHPRNAKDKIATSAFIPPSPLTALLDLLPTPPQQLAFVQADEVLPTPISKLPPELIEPILFHLDVTSIERFGSTCWRARYLTHTSLVWRRIAEKIYKPPAMLPLGEQIVGGGVAFDDAKDGQGRGDQRGKEDVRRREKRIVVSDLVKRHHGEWRTTFIEEERIRMDGCYIAVCHYIRPGAGEEWVTITHMITYHRFLRFYPDGNVISFLTTDHPSEIVPVLRPSIRGKGLHFGRWKLIRTDSPLHPSNTNTNNTTEASAMKNGANGNTNANANANADRTKKNARILITDLLEPGIEGPKYEFEMELALRSTGRGRWNKLEIIEYRSINLLTGEVLALALKHQKPFYFSKVRSYNPPL
ncbi:hypothetical protein IAU59_006803 [Kwoniella sp. CBS 9459]